MVTLVLLSSLAQSPRIHAFVGGDLGFASSPTLSSGGWGPAVELGVQLTDQLSMYAAARVSTVLVVLAPTHLLGAGFFEFRTPWRVGFALGVGWLFTHAPPFVDALGVDFSGPAFPVRVLFDFDNHVRLVAEAGLSLNLLPRAMGTSGWGALAVGYCWR
jgi:hypothetical protein